LQFTGTAAPKPYHDVEAGLSDTLTDLPLPPRRGRLLEAAKTKHIDPNCRSNEDAQGKSLERDADYPQEIGEINTVFKVDPDDFIIVPNNTHGEVVTSKEAVSYWDCRKISDFEYEVTDRGWMHAVFLMPDQGSHYCQRESRSTRSSKSSIQTRGSNRGRRNQRDSSRSRSRARN